MTAGPDIVIIGPGKVGTAIGMLAARAGLRVAAVGGRSLDRAEAAARAIGPGVRACEPPEAAAAGRLVLLTVPDDVIGPLCERLAAGGAFAPGTVVAHCCGAFGGEVLAAARRACGCAVGSMHPMQTFPGVQAAVRRMPGTYWFVEGDEPAAEALRRLAEAIGGKVVRIRPEGKPLHHAAAVMACNYVTALLDAAAALAEGAGVDRATCLAAMEPLVRATVDNVFSMGSERALTGPIARGDAGTVRRHLEAIGPVDDDLAALYRAVGTWAVRLARRNQSIDDATADALRSILEPTTRKE